MDFPQFRKLSNEMAFYKIIDDRHFEEIQVVGKRYFIYNHNDEQYPEILKIQEMLRLEIEGVISSDSNEYSTVYELAISL